MGVHQKCIGATGQTATEQMATEQMATEQIGLVWIDRWVLVDRLVRLSIDADRCSSGNCMAFSYLD